MTDKHTPGPWRNLGVKNMMVDGRCHRIVSDESYPAAFVPAWDRPNPGQECGKAGAESNARLIAAAPDLLAALEGMQQFFAMPDEGSTDRFDRLAEQYRRETGNCAPGKSIPDAFNDSTDPETLRAQYDAWVQGKVDAARAAIAKARGRV